MEKAWKIIKIILKTYIALMLIGLVGSVLVLGLLKLASLLGMPIF